MKIRLSFWLFFWWFFDLKWQWVCTFSWGWDQIENMFTHNSYPETDVTIPKINIFMHNFFPNYIIFCLPALNLNKRLNASFSRITVTTDYGCPVRKLPSLHGRKSTPNPKYLGTAEAYFVCHIGPNFQISLIYAFIGCP